METYALLDTPCGSRFMRPRLNIGHVLCPRYPADEGLTVSVMKSWLTPPPKLPA